MISLPFILAAMTNASEPVSCLDHIISSYFGKNVLLVTEGEVLLQPDLISSLKERAIVLYRDEKPETDRLHRNYDTVVFGLKNVRDLSRIFQGKHSGKIVVVVMGHTPHYLARHVISSLWELTRGVNVIVLAVENSTVDVYSWFPYKEGECAEVKEIVLMNTWKSGSFLLKKNLFPQKVKKDFNGCPLHASTHPIVPYVFDPKVPDKFPEGYEVMIVKDLVREFNMTLKMVNPIDPNMLWNTEGWRSSRGVIHQLVSHEVDLLFGGTMAQGDRYKQTEAIYPYTMEHLLWMYPKPSFETHFTSVFIVFSPQLWMLVIIFHFFIAVSLSVIVKYLHFEDETHYTGLVQCFFNAIAVLCSTTSPLPRNGYTRFLVLCYVIYAMHLSASYQSYLIVLVTHSGRKDPFRNINELAESEMTVYLFSPTRHLYNETDHSAWRKILQPNRVKYFNDMNIPPIVNDIAVNRTSFLLFPKSALVLTTSLMYRDDGKSLFEYLNHLTYPLTMYVSPGNPLEIPFSKHVQSLLESGVLQYWEKMTMASAKKHRMKWPQATEDEPNFPAALSIKQLEGAFLLLCVSLSFGFIALLGEMLFHWLSTRADVS